MKTRQKQRLCKFQLALVSYGYYYIRRAAKLETALAKKPKTLRLDLIGEGEIPADTTLLIRSIIMARSPRTRLVTNARSSLQGGAVLVWLLGDQRLIRDDARVFFKRNPLADEDPVEVYAGLGELKPKYKDSYSDVDPEDADYARILECINEFLPVDEYAGRIIRVPLLREFGLIGKAPMDDLLAAAFAKPKEFAPAPRRSKSRVTTKQHAAST